MRTLLPLKMAATQSSNILLFKIYINEYIILSMFLTNEENQCLNKRTIDCKITLKHYGIRMQLSVPHLIF